MRAIVRSAVMGALALILAGCATTTGRIGCDRACLMQSLNAYLAALQASDVASAHLARDFRATSNGVAIAPSAMTFRALGDVQRFYADPVSGQAAYLGIIDDSSGQALTAIRIRVEDGEISESEQFIARQGDTLFSLEGFRALPPRSTPPPGARRSRDEMVAAANSYFEGLSTHNSAIIQHVAGCERLENGTRVTNRPPRQPANAVEAVEFQPRDCAGGMESMTQIREVAFRRFPLVDEEADVVMGIGLFLRPPGQTGTFARRNLLTEFFELQDGKISGIYAVMHYIDADAPDGTGWE
jgi:hypothetical protein